MPPLARIRQNLLVIRERYDVARIGIFGSVARNEETPASDIDILVEFREGTFYSKPDGFSRSAPAGASRPAPDGARVPALRPVAHFMDLKFYLEDLLGRKTALVIADTLKPRIRDAVLEGVVYAWGPSADCHPSFTVLSRKRSNTSSSTLNISIPFIPIFFVSGSSQ